jgi:hypothetical protein
MASELVCLYRVLLQSGDRFDYGDADDSFGGSGGGGGGGNGDGDVGMTWQEVANEVLLQQLDAGRLSARAMGSSGSNANQQTTGAPDPPLSSPSSSSSSSSLPAELDEGQVRRTMAAFQVLGGGVEPVREGGSVRVRVDREDAEGTVVKIERNKNRFVVQALC